MKTNCTCDWCGKEFRKESCKVKPHNFCSRNCLANFSNKTKNPEHYSELKDYSNISKNMTILNKKLNPTRMTDEVRERVRRARLDSGGAKTYRKIHGRHEHRAVMEEMVGRKLTSKEIVHHIDGDKRNNSPSNLMLFANQSEHARYHAEQNRKGVV